MNSSEINHKKPIYKDINFWFGFIGIIAFIFSIYTYLFPGEANVKFYMLDNTSILDVKEEVSKLNITYDSINLLESDMDISIIILQVKNDGKKNINVNDYDQSIGFGVKITKGTLLKKPELTGSSENEYYKDIINRYDYQSAYFKFKLIDEDKFFNLKFLVLHKKNVLPVLVPIGKISGVRKISMTNTMKSKEYEELKSKQTLLIYVILGAAMAILMFFIIRLQKNIISSTKAKVEALQKINDQLYNEISNSPKNPLEYEETLSEDKILTFEEILNLQEGEIVYHQRFGKGEVVAVRRSKILRDSMISIKFELAGIKGLLIRFAMLKK